MTTTMAPMAGTKKKARKPYTITRPRERWSGEEHDRFLHALMLFGRDWKRIQGFVATKTAIQIRSHAQKHFLKARKFGLAGGLPPPLHPRRAALLRANAAAADMMPPLWLPSAGSGSIGCSPPPSGVQQSMSHWPAACYSPEDSFRPLIHSYDDDCSFIGTPNCIGSGGESWIGDAAFFSRDETILLPISPDDLGFAQVYKFVGDMFGSGERRPVEAHLRRLQGMDPAISETIHHRLPLLPMFCRFGRDWKRIQRFVATKTAIQVAIDSSPSARSMAGFRMEDRLGFFTFAFQVLIDLPWFIIQILSHAQKHFLKARNGLGKSWLGDAAFFLQDETILLPISPDDLGFAMVYKFVGDVLGSGERRPVEAHLRRLQGMDPAISETILLVLKNLEANLVA
uniref:HTH myb-type domain-containing protein n=1 Tax=Oryza punctata TaxID=4537 RepID=A0A0E0KYU8_ORYPU